jgi:hypothetical protein
VPLVCKNSSLRVACSSVTSSFFEGEEKNGAEMVYGVAWRFGTVWWHQPTAGHGQPGPKIPGRAGLACQAGFGPDFGARTSGRARARACRKHDLSLVRAVLCRARPGFSLFGPGLGPISKPEGRAGPGSGLGI